MNRHDPYTVPTMISRLQPIPNSVVFQCISQDGDWSNYAQSCIAFWIYNYVLLELALKSTTTALQTATAVAGVQRSNTSASAFSRKVVRRNAHARSHWPTKWRRKWSAQLKIELADSRIVCKGWFSINVYENLNFCGVHFSLTLKFLISCFSIEEIYFFADSKKY